MAASWGPANSALSLNNKELNIAASGADIDFSSVSDEMDFDYMMPRYEYGLTLPLSGSDIPQKAGLFIGLYDLIPAVRTSMLPENVTDLFNQPITVSIDVEADVALSADVFDEKFLNSSPEDFIDLTGFRVNDLTVSGVGSAMIATGLLALPGGLKSMSAGSMPAGNIDVELKRIPELLAILQEIGIATPDMGMMLMMAQGMSVPGEGGSMVFKVESKDGAVSVNGNRVR
jgi:hypothetical protein